MTEPKAPADSYISAGGVRVHYLDWGNPDAQTMVLLHGIQDCARSWDFFAERLRDDYRVLALDNRGHGDSEWAGACRYGFSDYVSDLKCLIDELGLQKIVLIGHSAGARYAFSYAANRPEAIESLVIVDIDPDAVNPRSGDMFARYAEESDEWGSMDDVVERLRDRQPDSTDDMLLHQAEWMTRPLGDGRRIWKRDPATLPAYERPDLWDDLKRISCPTLIVRGRQSELLNHEVAVRMREAVPGSRLAELEGAGHWVYQELPEAFEITIRWFLENARR